MDSNLIITIAVFGILILAVVGYQLYDIYLSMRPDRLRVFILDTSLNMHKLRVKIVEEDSFIVGETRYTVVPSCIYKMGLLRIPTSYYTKGASEPHDLINRGLESQISAEQYHARTSNKIVYDIINAFSPPMITPTMSFIIMILAMIGGFGYLWWDLGGKLDEILQALQAVNQLPGPTPGFDN